jgi:hypothetical protein
MPISALFPAACLKVLLTAGSAHNMITAVPMNNGDNAGVNPGVASGVPATKMTSMSGQNGMSMNIPGMTLVPSQFKVMLMR